jgi:hypothetical protein
MVNGAVKIKYRFITTILGKMGVLKQDFPMSRGVTRAINDNIQTLLPPCSGAGPGAHKNNSV